MADGILMVIMMVVNSGGLMEHLPPYYPCGQIFSGQDAAVQLQSFWRSRRRGIFFMAWVDTKTSEIRDLQLAIFVYFCF
jgi:hypothetical protein